ncbi:MAG: hypothetical protein WC742_10900 [Gallionellaceae bacterium]|jgi:hypothetical protein
MRLAEIVQEQTQRSDIMLAQEKSLAQIWDNPDDEVWNHIEASAIH